MGKIIINSETLSYIAEAIRSTGRSEELIYPYEMPDAIRGILPFNVEFGEFVPDADLKTVAVEHHLGEIPYAVFIWKDDMSLDDGALRAAISVNGPLEDSEYAERVISSYGLARSVNDGAEFYSTTPASQGEGEDGYGDTDTHFYVPVSPQTYYRAGTKYKWMAVAR